MRFVILAALTVVLAACQKPTHRTADGLPYVPHPNATGDGVPVNDTRDSD